jgi:hypothetical protein
LKERKRITGLKNCYLRWKIVICHFGPELWGVAVKARRNTLGAINHSRGVLHRSYKKSLPCGVPQELFCKGKMRYFRGTGMIFPRLALL